MGRAGNDAQTDGPAASDAKAGSQPGVRPAMAADSDAMAEVFIQAWRQAYPGVVRDEVLAGLDHDQTAAWPAGLIERRPEGETDVAVGARRLYSRAGYAPDGSTRVEPEYQAAEIRLVKVLR